ncbi:MAG: hypothetical protein IPH34_04700 [Chitinophagaceae bacterium]|nr:hypothetical protein [Chitinophagaceae bacterium]
MKQILISLSLLFAAVVVKAQEPVQTTKQILNEAYALAAKENKKYLSCFMHPGVVGAIRWIKV